jgi:hypothetical protein
MPPPGTTDPPLRYHRPFDSPLLVANRGRDAHWIASPD